jgi:UDP-N-acetylglucosamine 2-epimerase (non-hydrolysing)
LVKVLHVVGARPNFMKAAPVLRALSAHRNVQQVLVHTGQHYDEKMSDVFFQELGIPEPDVNLQVGSGSHAQQTAGIMTAFEPVVLERKPDVVVVYGDVNSTIAAALVCSKLGVRVAHVEAGLRSRDRTMPEEVNRIVTDQLADLLFTPSSDGNENLLKEGVPEEKIFFVGNVMVDTLLRLLPSSDKSMPPNISGKYALVTLHRPSNVDDPIFLVEVLKALEEIGGEMAVIFPVHPRTKQKMLDTGWTPKGNGRMQLLEPLAYLAFLALQNHATVVITDSGGIQEETTLLGTPCLTMRENTERPVTITMGTNRLVGRSIPRMKEAIAQILRGDKKTHAVPPLWDGKASERIAEIVAKQ